MSEESEVEARSVLVSNFLVKKDKASALAASLQNPPVNEKSEELKVAPPLLRHILFAFMSCCIFILV